MRRVGVWAREAREARGTCGTREAREASEAREARGTRGTRGTREARESAWERVRRVAGPPETSGGAWARVWRARNFWQRVRGQIRPILVSMDRS